MWVRHRAINQVEPLEAWEPTLATSELAVSSGFWKFFNHVNRAVAGAHSVSWITHSFKELQQHPETFGLMLRLANRSGLPPAQVAE